jgi:hypothetical protein
VCVCGFVCLFEELRISKAHPANQLRYYFPFKLPGPGIGIRNKEVLCGLGLLSLSLGKGRVLEGS